MKFEKRWPKKESFLYRDGSVQISVPFTWRLPAVKEFLTDAETPVVVGGPAVRLMPEFLGGIKNVTVSLGDLPGAVTQINPLATKTTEGCPNRCSFCAVPRTEGAFREFDEWPDRPVLIDNNILHSSQKHFDRVCDRLEKWGWCDFNQGIDARLLTEYHAKRLGRIGSPQIRLACDSSAEMDIWENAFTLLRKQGIRKNLFSSYILIGHMTGPEECWKRCLWVEGHNINPLPMWFHRLDCMEWNEVTEKQKELGWDRSERTRIMGYFYKRRGSVPDFR